MKNSVRPLKKECAKEWRFVAPASWNMHEVRQFTMCIIHAVAESCWTYCKLCCLFEGNVLWPLIALVPLQQPQPRFQCALINAFTIFGINDPCHYISTSFGIHCTCCHPTTTWFTHYRPMKINNRRIRLKLLTTDNAYQYLHEFPSEMLSC